MAYDHRVVPRDRKENAAWRAKTLELAANSETFQREVLELCRKDFWYWATGFAYVHEPRILDDKSSTLDTKVAFIPWPHQIPVVDRILLVLGKRDLRILKSRAQGATWLLVLIFLWCWLFRKGFKGNMVSKDEAAIDKRNDMNSVMAKFDWLIAQLPKWMVGRRRHDWLRNHTDHIISRTDGETALTGFACTSDVGSGGRATAFALDEHGKHPRGPDKAALAATQPITRCRIFVSTPKGMDGAFYEICNDSSIEEPILKLDWRDNPTQNRGLYRVVDGWPVPVDVQKYGQLPDSYRDKRKWALLYSRLEERGYDLTNKRERSPWYDEECLRPGADPVMIAQEYDMDFGSSMARFFSEALVGRLKAKSVRPPIKGEFYVDRETLRGHWSANPEGRFRLWVPLDINGRPPVGEYIVACDVAAGLGGSGSSNSAISVLNRRNGEKVAAFASPSVLPYDLAELAIGLCYWFSDESRPAFLNWEANGPGGEFKKRLERTDFNFYYRRKQGKDASLYSRDTDKGGYWTHLRSDLLGPYREALLEGFFCNHDSEAIEELRQYEMGQDGEPVHVAEKTRDPSGAKKAHGDRVTADAIAWHTSLSFGDQLSALGDGRKMNVNNVREELVPANSAAWRRARYLDTLRRTQTKSRW